MEKNTKETNIRYGTKEYEKAYKEGKVTRKIGDTYIAPTLEEVTIRPKEYNPIGVAINKKLNNIGNGIVKTMISFTPYSPIISASELISSYTPGSSNYGDHRNTLINSGLELLPLGLLKSTKLIGRGVGKVKPKYKDNLALAMNISGDTPHSAQNRAAVEASMKYNNLVYNNGKLAPEIAKRVEKLGFPTKVKNSNVKLSIIDEDTSLRDFGDRLRSRKRNQLMDRHNTKGISGTTDDKGNIALFRRNPEGRMYSPEEIAETTYHENFHRLQSRTGWTLDKPSNGYYTANESIPIAAKLKPYLGKDSWAKSADEVWADLYAFRMANDIGVRNLTDKEALNAVEYLARHWDMSKFGPKAITDLKHVVKTLPITIPISIGTNLKNTKNE